MAFYLAGYHLIQLKSANLFKNVPSRIFTCSSCINDHLVDRWSYSWVLKTQDEIQEIKSKLSLTNEQFHLLENWVNDLHQKNLLGWANVFQDIQTATQYKERFFKNHADIYLLSLYVDGDYRSDILEIFASSSEHVGEIGIYQCLKKGIREDCIPDEKLLGYDYIGLEVSGDFHSFHCHDLSKNLVEKFDLTLNEFGLFEEPSKSDQIEAFLNDNPNGFEAVPWGIAKVKLVNSW
ncbi:hypothetical protein KTJ32_04475 [Acinetobacter gyllenbergii]|uniref:hypothetical protein n=1 Tax=Acinetobacter gyllenbergii TaxID=134534 RepID=UPI0021D18149|nr:hypothetical protein [Acinetobacter gyllenbergii]MCU4580255.1 hypothetical protein [Acinetobacter gyllenbergii]